MERWLLVLIFISKSDMSVDTKSGQSQFASLKLRPLALVPSSGALSRPYELHLWQLHCKTLPSAPGALWSSTASRRYRCDSPSFGVGWYITRFTTHPYSSPHTSPPPSHLCRWPSLSCRCAKLHRPTSNRVVFLPLLLV